MPVFISDPGGKIAKMDEGAYPSLPPPTVDKTFSGSDLSSDYKGAVGLVSVIITTDGKENVLDQGTLVIVTPSGYALMSKNLMRNQPQLPENITITANNWQCFVTLNSG